MRFMVLVLAVFIISMPDTFAGGLGGDLIRLVPIPGARELGDTLDKTHDDIKNTIQPYKQVEEGISGVVRHGSQQIVGEAGAPLLKNWIIESRNDAIRAGVSPIPIQVRSDLSGFFSEQLLNSVKFRVGQGHELSLQANSFRFGDRDAITLDNVIVFRDWSDAQSNLPLWAHELGHVLQYQDGIDNFAKRYLRDYQAVERDAENVSERFVAWYKEQKRYASQSAASPSPAGSYNRGQVNQYSSYPVSNICATTLGSCQINQVGQVGNSCWCPSSLGVVWGVVVGM